MTKNYNVGIIGYGWAATAHIAAINATTQGRVAAVWSSRPLDSAEDHAAPALAATAAQPEGKIAKLFIGGMFCEMEFVGDPDRIR